MTFAKTATNPVMLESYTPIIIQRHIVWESLSLCNSCKFPMPVIMLQSYADGKNETRGNFPFFSGEKNFKDKHDVIRN
ncbi:hypothetical protein ASG38_02950 [Flavobacterium sp. Leaf359]|jgi:hypothetical protein|nr:hypothetical protein ASG38_02950 [Flavobacterium sp. Leaf359]